MSTSSPIGRAKEFCQHFNLDVPILMAPMAGACPVELAAAVANAGGMAACGTLLMKPGDIGAWSNDFRAASNGCFQLNIWIPDPDPVRDADNEAAVRTFLRRWGPEVPAAAGDFTGPAFEAQCEAMLAAGPTVISSIMGLYPESFVAAMRSHGVSWFATVTTVTEARAAEQAGADVIVAQGMEAGGHRGAFLADEAERAMVGLFSLVPAVVDAVSVPVVATGGIADARGAAAALLLGASAVQIGTGFLRSPEAGIAPAWADALGQADPEGTIVTRAFSGRTGRSLATAYARASNALDTPPPAPYPVQRGLTGPMRAEGLKQGDIDRIQGWAGQSSRLAEARPAGEIVSALWEGVCAMLGRP